MADSNTDIDEAQQPDLDEATPPRPIDEMRVLHKTSTTLTAHVLGPRGMVIDVTITDVPYDGLDGTALRAIAFEKALAQKGLKPIGPVAAASSGPAPTAAAAQPQAGQGPVEIPGEDGKPPRCSIHGAMKWLEGTTKTGQNAGKHYEFWACQTRDCRPAKQGA